MNNYTASTYSKALEDALHTDQAFVVHSVFQSGMNLAFWERLLYLGSDLESMKPFGVMLPEKQLASLMAACRQGDSGVYLRKNKRLVWESGIELELSEADIWDGKIEGKKRERDWVTNSLKHLNCCWEKHNPEYGLMQEFPQKTQIITSLKEVANGSPETITKQLDFWVGRGLGLTPGGDDMLVGLMALMYWTQHPFPWESLLDYLRKNGRNRTTAISNEYLHYAINGIFSHVIIDVLENMPDRKLCESALKKLLAVGHSSGADTIIGIISGLELLMEE
jgi:hypothetical protein